MVRSRKQRTTRPVRRIVATAAAAGGLVVGGVIGFGSIAGAATEGSEHHGEAMHDHESMMNMMSDMEMPDGAPMGRMHAEMVSSSADMARMHAHMMSSHPEMRKMHADMVSGGQSAGG